MKNEEEAPASTPENIVKDVEGKPWVNHDAIGMMCLLQNIVHNTTEEAIHSDLAIMNIVGLRKPNDNN